MDNFGTEIILPCLLLICLIVFVIIMLYIFCENRITVCCNLKKSEETSERQLLLASDNEDPHPGSDNEDPHAGSVNEDPHAAPEISGIENTGSSCYLNSVIQILASSELLLAEINRIQNGGNPSEELVLFIRILQDLNKPHSKHIHNDLETLMILSGWDKQNQQDAFELLCKVINSIERSIGGIKLPLKVRLKTVCFMRLKPQYYMGLSLGLCGNYQEKPGAQLESLIENHFDTSFIDGDPEQPTRFYWYGNLPSVLLIHIQANKSDGRGNLMKPKYFIKYKYEMELNCEIKDDKDEIEKKTNTYHLVGLVEHLGSINSGHYFCYRKYNNQWYLISDTQVEKKSEEELTESPYLLLYDAKQ